MSSPGRRPARRHRHTALGRGEPLGQVLDGFPHHAKTVQLMKHGDAVLTLLAMLIGPLDKAAVGGQQVHPEHVVLVAEIHVVFMLGKLHRARARDGQTGVMIWPRRAPWGVEEEVARRSK